MHFIGCDVCELLLLLRCDVSDLSEHGKNRAILLEFRVQFDLITIYRYIFGEQEEKKKKKNIMKTNQETEP